MLSPETTFLVEFMMHPQSNIYFERHPSEDQLEAFLLRKLPNRLDGGQRQMELSAIAQHLSDCPACRTWADEETQQIEELRSALSALNDVIHEVVVASRSPIEGVIRVRWIS